MLFKDGLEIERAMVVFAHPDDAEWGSAGTSAAWADQGVEITYVLVTNGASGSSDPEMTRERLSEIRFAEQRAAADIVGVKNLVALGFEDGYLYPTLELRKAIAREIRRFRPDVVISHDPTARTAMGAYINHPDHLAVGEAVMRSINPDASSGLMFPELWKEEGFAPHLPKALMLGTFGEGDTHVDISSTIDRKIEALLCHVSQISESGEIEKWVRERFAAAGKTFGVDFAETYRMFRVGG